MNKVFKRFNGLFLLLAFTLVSVGVQAQEAYTLTGTVVDSNNGEVLPGSNIVIAGTSQGTATDFDGKFELSVKNGDKLEVSFMGYTTQTVVITGQKVENIKLAISTDQQLADVIVVGYGVQKRSHSTGSIAKMDDENFADAPVARADEALIGKLSGVEIATTDAGAGASPKILIRGISSMSGNSNPLIVVDGFPIPGDLSSVDMNDVQSIEVLKDAASAAVYGSRGANGVIMITTKTGKKGKLSFDVNVINGIKSAYKRDDLYATPSAWMSDLEGQGFDGGTFFAKMKELGTATNWQDEIFRTGKFSKYQMGANAGGEWGNFYIGGSYQSEEGVVITNKYDKFSLRANVNAKLSDRVEVGLQLSGNRSVRRDAAVGMQDALRNQPWLPKFHTDKTLAFIAANGISTDGISVGDIAHESQFDKIVSKVPTTYLQLTNNNSAYAKLEGRDNSYIGLEVMSNAYVQVKVIEGLTFKSTLGTYYSNTQREWFQSSWGIRTGAIESTYDTQQKTTMLNENTLNYTKKVGKHEFSVLGGLMYQADTYKRLGLDGASYNNDLIHNLNAAGSVALNNAYQSETTLASMLFRINYSLMDRYLVSVTTRRDGSSRFGKDVRWGSFPSVSLGWRVSEEAFMKPITMISSLKLRATYGTTGNNNIDDYATISTLAPVNAIVNGTRTGYAGSGISNSELGWERTIETNLGLDLGLADNRFNLSVNYYQTKKDQLLLQLPVPTTTGFDQAWRNIGQLSTKGFEIDFSSVNIASDGFEWKTSVNFSHNSNKVENFGNVNNLISTPDPKRPTQWIVQVGGPLSQFYGYEVERELTPSELTDPTYPIGVTAAKAIVKDQNNDGKITDADRVVLGNPYPDFTWGLTNEFKYKDFDLSILINGSQGAETANIDPYYFESQWKGIANETLSEKDAKALIDKTNTSLIIQDASYISLRNITLGYTAPKALANRIGMQRLRAYVSAQNLLYLMGSNYTSFNPEAQNLDSDPYNQFTSGAQRGGSPITRTVSLGLNLSF